MTIRYKATLTLSLALFLLLITLTSVHAYNCIETDCIDPVIFENDHELHGPTPLTYTFDLMKSDWDNPGWERGLDEGRATIAEDESSSKYLRMLFEKDTFGFSNGTGWQYQFRESYNELYIQYRIRFEEGYDFQLGGKIPGLAGGDGNTGGDKPDGTDGWSARMMWQRDGGLIQYVYHPDQPSSYGDVIRYRNTDGSLFQFETGRWYTLKNRVKINTPGLKDGIVEGWVDGQKMMYRDNFRFRDVDTFSIDQVRFTVFYGGNTQDWAPNNDSYMNLDDFVISHSDINSSGAGSSLSTSSSEACVGDYDNSGVRNIADLQIFAQNYKIANLDCSLDLIGNNCRLDIADFSLFAQSYRKSCN